MIRLALTFLLILCAPACRESRPGLARAPETAEMVPVRRGEPDERPMTGPDADNDVADTGRSRPEKVDSGMPASVSPQVTPISRVEAAPGLVIERHRASARSPVGVGDRVITLVRADPGRFQPRLLTARSDGGARTMPGWLADFDLAAVINASMFHPNRQSTGLMIRRGRVNNGQDNPAFGGILAFDPIGGATPALRAFGRDCPGWDLDRIRARYETVIQNYRMLDCGGRPFAWADRKAYSVAAIGVDSAGWLVMVHSRTPYLMTVFNRMMATPALRLRSLMFVEGGPEASLTVGVGEHRLQEVGSWETDFNERDDNRRFWPIPNVLGVAPRASDG
jgi:hypothetical protein